MKKKKTVTLALLILLIISICVIQHDPDTQPKPGLQAHEEKPKKTPEEPASEEDERKLAEVLASRFLSEYRRYLFEGTRGRPEPGPYSQELKTEEGLRIFNRALSEDKDFNLPRHVPY